MRKRNGLLVVVVTVVVVGAGMGVRGWGEEKGKLPFTVSKETTGIVGPLRADGTVDYLGAVNEKYGKGVTAENNGFVDYIEAVGTEEGICPPTRDRELAMCGASPTAKGAEVWGMSNGYSIERDGPETKERVDFRRAMQSLWMEADHPEVAAYLKGKEKLLARALVAAGKPRWWIGYVSLGAPGMNRLMLPAPGPVRGMAEALCARGMLEAKGGDFDGFLRDMMGAKRLARHVGSGATLIERLVGVGTDMQVDGSIGAAVGQGIWSAEQIRRLRKGLEALPELPGPVEAVDNLERWGMLDSIAYLSQQPTGRSGFGKARGFDTIDQKSVHYDVVLKMANARYDGWVVGMKERSIKDVRKKVEEGSKRAGALAAIAAKNGGSLAREAGETEEAYSHRVGEAVMAQLGPELGKSEEFYRIGRMKAQLLWPLMAAAEVKARTGKWPASLEAMVPRELKEVLRDEYSEGGKEGVKYGVTEKGVRVYSVGKDGVDDGGEKDDISVGMAGGG